MMYLSLPLLHPQKQPTSVFTLVAPTEEVLKFDSRFESGNLRRAAKVSEDEYSLVLEYDFHTRGHTQWYYFSVQSYKANHSVKFSICNLVKLDSLYNEGLQPCVYSRKEQERTGTTWHRAGTSVAYGPSTELRPGSQKPYYTLTFTYEFQHPDDTVYFAHCFPYTYTELEGFLDQVQTSHRDICRVETLCMTLARNSCRVLTITSEVQSYQDWAEELDSMKKAAPRRPTRYKDQRTEVYVRALDSAQPKEVNEHSKKKGVFLSARVHPGESNSSFMMRGTITFLLSDAPEAKRLRQLYVFKVIPMLNPDGVVYGNYRCSLLGVDLNRRWLQPSKQLHPTVYYAKRLLQSFAEDRELVMSCDMHGHSMKRNAFMYGCASRSQDVDDKRRGVLARVIPFLLAEKNKLFSFTDCRFRLEKSKESTQRIVVHRALGVHSYTLEASFLGPTHSAALENRVPTAQETSGDCHMGVSHLESIGSDVCKVLLVLARPSLLRSKVAEMSSGLNPAKSSPQPQSLSQGPSDRGLTVSKGLTANETDLCLEDSWEEVGDEAISLNDFLDSVKVQSLAEMSLCDDESEGSDECPSDNDEIKWELGKPQKLKKRTFKKKRLSKPPQLKEERPKKPEQVPKVLPKLRPFTRRQQADKPETPKPDIKRQIDQIYSLCKA
jgi:hypothetical protein